MAWRRWLRALANRGRPGRRTWPVRLRLEALEERCVPSAWVSQTPGTAQLLFSVWGSGPNDIFAVGVDESGHPGILHSSNDGVVWDAPTSGGTPSVQGVWGNGPGDVFVVGEGGKILHSTNDGASWDAQASGTIKYLSGVWGSGPNDVYAVGNGGTIFHSTN